MRLSIFVHSLILALCSASTVLAAKDSQTDIGAVLNQQAVATQLSSGVAARKVVAGAQVNFSGQISAQKPSVLVVAARDTGATAKTKSSVASSESRASGVDRASFQKLDVEAENVLREVLDLSSDLAIIEEQQLNPPKNQLLVLVTLQASKFFELDFVELKIDNQIVAAHPYTEKVWKTSGEKSCVIKEDFILFRHTFFPLKP